MTDQREGLASLAGLLKLKLQTNKVPQFTASKNFHRNQKFYPISVASAELPSVGSL